MKKLLTSLMLVAFVLSTVFVGILYADTLTYGPTYYRDHLQEVLSGSTRSDPFYLFFNEVDDLFNGTGTTEIVNLLFDNAITSNPTSTEGRMYYNTSSNLFRFYNGSSWVNIEANTGGVSLDGSYDLGSDVTVDNGAVALTGTNAADNTVLQVVQSDTGTSLGIDINNAGSGNSIDIEGTSGNDIEGTGDTWSVTTAGVITFVGGTTTGDLTVTGSAADIAFDVSDDELAFNDSAVLTFGTSSDATIAYDGGNNDLDITSTSALDEIALGATGDGFDVIWHSTTAGDYLIFDYSADAILLEDLTLALGDGELLLFGDTLGTGDFSIVDTADKWVFDTVVAGTGEVEFGNDADDMPMKWYTDTTGDWVYFNDDEVEFEDCVLQMMDATQIQFGDSDDFFMHATNQAMTLGTLTSNETSAWNFGADTDGDDLKFFGATTAEYWLWDASADSILPVCGNALYTMTDAEANQFKVNATGAVAGIAIQLETTSGGIHLLADGVTAGDITLDAQDDLTLITTGSLVVTNTDAMTISGAATVEGVLTANGTIVGDGVTTLTGTKATVETYIAAGNTITIAESGSVYENTGDADGTLHTLPEASTAIGCSYTFVVTETGQQIVVELDNADVFLHLSLDAGDQIQSSTLGDTITVMAVSASQWAVISVYPLAADWADGGA